MNTSFNLPPIVTPEQAAHLDLAQWQKAKALVENINKQLSNVSRGERKIVIIPMYLGEAVYKMVRSHFQTAWNIRVVPGITGDPHDQREQSWHQWQFSEPGQMDR